MERKIAAVCRAVALRVASENEVSKVLVDEKMIVDVLGVSAKGNEGAESVS